MAEHVDDYGNNTDSEDELDIIGDKYIGGGNNIDACESKSDWVGSDQAFENMDDPDELNIEENVQYKEDDTHFHSFLPDHPQ